MSILSIAWRNLKNRKVQTLITLLVVAIGIAMSLSVLILAEGIRDGIREASAPYGMLVGTKGSGTQLVLNTIFLMDTPLGNLDIDVFEALQQDERVQLAVPFALGDSYSGFRIVGTSSDFFSLTARPGEPAYFQIKEGRSFHAPFEAVIGHTVAKQTGLKIGDTFVSSHGVVKVVEEEHHHEHPFQVVGILEKKQAPADQGIYVSIDSYWISHGQMNGPWAKENQLADPSSIEEQVPGVTAILLKPHSYVGLMELYQEINDSLETQAVMPGQVLAKMFDLMGSGELFLQNVSYVVLVMACLTIVLSLYSATLERRKTVAILRAMGAKRSFIFSMVLVESLLIVLLGASLGLVGSFLLSGILTVYIAQYASIAISISFHTELLQVIALVSLLGILAGLLPAYLAYRTEVAQHLSST